jgi:hypothetical protein
VESVDLKGIPVVDNHCHGIRPDGAGEDPVSFRRTFTESADPRMPRDHVATTAFYRRLLYSLAAFLGCEPEEDAVLTARAGMGGKEIISLLLRDANVEVLLLDTGFPPPEEVLLPAELAGLAGCRAATIPRLEALMQRLITEHDSLDDVKEALKTELSDVRGQGHVALKSIAAYRTGLEIVEWPVEEAEAAFWEARRDIEEGGRLTHKPLLDTLLHVAFAEAARQEVPVQFHVGYGDADTDLRLGNPLHLRAVFEAPKYRGMPVVLLHECYPFTREGGYLAAVYGNAYLDLSYAIPLLGYGEMLSFTRHALGVAPTSKLLYSSDGTGASELHWMGAHDGRRVLGEALGGMVSHGEMSVSEAEATGEAVLRGNAERVYGL